MSSPLEIIYQKVTAYIIAGALDNSLEATIVKEWWGGVDVDLQTLILTALKTIYGNKDGPSAETEIVTIGLVLSRVLAELDEPELDEPDEQE